MPAQGRSAHVIVICGGVPKPERTVRPALAWSASMRGIHAPDRSAVLPGFARRWGCGCEAACEPSEHVAKDWRPTRPVSGTCPATWLASIFETYVRWHESSACGCNGEWDGQGEF